MTTPGKELRVLAFEDSPVDCELLELELRRSGYRAQIFRVDTIPALREALRQPAWDVILADFNLPGLTALDALACVKTFDLDLPFIVVSGSAGEDIAVQAMKAGAHDFFSKAHLTRLSSAIERELREARIRQEHRLAVAQIRETNQRLTAIFNQTIVGIAQVDTSGQIVLANARFCRLLGSSQQAIVSSSFLALIHPDDRSQAREGLADLAVEGHGYVTELRYLRPDGSFVWGGTSASGLRDASGAHAGLVLIVEDVGERKRVELELQAAVRVRDEFISIASHELKTPLTALELQVSSALGRLRKSEAPWKDGVEPKLASAVRQTERLAVLINNLLDVTRITSGRLNLTRSAMDLRGLVEAVVRHFQEFIRHSRSTVSVRADGPVEGHWDPVRMESIVTNLLSNAIKYGEGNPIDIELSRKDNCAQLVVTDRGLGISPEDHKRVFERFERAVPSEHYGGLGLGLWIARHSVEAHGGTIEVSSRPFEGSQFTVKIPVSPAGVQP